VALGALLFGTIAPLDTGLPLVVQVGCAITVIVAGLASVIAGVSVLGLRRAAADRLSERISEALAAALRL